MPSLIAINSISVPSGNTCLTGILFCLAHSMASAFLLFGFNFLNPGKFQKGFYIGFGLGKSTNDHPQDHKPQYIALCIIVYLTMGKYSITGQDSTFKRFGKDFMVDIYR